MHRQNMDGNSYLFTQVSIFPVIQSTLVSQEFIISQWNISNEYIDNVLEEEFFHSVLLIGRCIIVFSQLINYSKDNNFTESGIFICSGCRFKMLPADSVSQNAQVIGFTPPIHPGSHGWV